MNIKAIHDFVKYNYERGNYHNAEFVYRDFTHYNTIKSNHYSEKSDYQIGYNQAKIDYQREHCFHSYPDSLLELTNKLSDNHLLEIVDFIKGYDAYKNKIVH
ncbi:hypothetical protein LCR01_13950 [Companilactobacillus crustorum]|uniref:Uncharacterized protein n=3 Tax=Companilactobacillus TaxID=2767879 RepID=A0A837RG37_9LACO|nr:hypothetical protein [Companilactobacillus crustorum]HCD07262.1 hypothetical protein [Lactobacillus sp.]APU71512.1 hypothetical protein BI355_1193 [Companilactobacillus crustorum]KRK42049.1 hypothetical protein FD26_GL000920 [Companilactobacillus crustorum JCM 15951]KRO20077.1 hypothetical protein IV63_GL001031 [Companilactobacillus crustorum]WDT66463.1 hypothetical protein NV391_04470 [Companilactobacillus crustorum]